MKIKITQHTNNIKKYLNECYATGIDMNYNIILHLQKILDLSLLFPLPPKFINMRMLLYVIVFAVSLCSQGKKISPYSKLIPQLYFA